MTTTRTAIACFVLVLGATTACSDDDERLSKAEYLEQGNAICAEANEKIEAATGDVEVGADGQPSTETIAAVFDETIIPSITDELDQLQELSPPEDLESDFDQLFADAEAALDDVRQQLDDDPEAFVTSEEDPFADVNERATELGLAECGAGG